MGFPKLPASLWTPFMLWSTCRSSHANIEENVAAKLSSDEMVAQKLDTLIRLQARIAISHLATQKERILFLSSAGLVPKEIGDILGVTANSVSVALLQARKSAAKAPKKDVANGIE
jgi:DNA-binding CsgD family transcriptional regulator